METKQEGGSIAMTIRVDMTVVYAQIEGFVRKALLLPDHAADFLQRDLLGFLDCPDAREFLSLERLPATGAGDLVFQARIRGLDELFAAAACAAQGDVLDADLIGHRDSPGVEDGGVGAPDSTFGENLSSNAISEFKHG